MTKLISSITFANAPPQSYLLEYLMNEWILFYFLSSLLRSSEVMSIEL